MLGSVYAPLNAQNAQSSKSKPSLSSVVAWADGIAHRATIDNKQRTITFDLQDAASIQELKYRLSDQDEEQSISLASIKEFPSLSQSVSLKIGGKKQKYTLLFPQLYKRIFVDDFSTDGAPSPELWQHIKPYAGKNSDWREEMSGLVDQAFVQEGKLILKAEKVGDSYRAGGIEMHKSLPGFTYGKVEVKARLTSLPDGAFPAIWLMPRTWDKATYPAWPACGEIDIMEHVRQEDVTHASIHTAYQSSVRPGPSFPQRTATVKCNFTDWVVYGVEWTEDKLVFTTDGKVVLEYPNLKLEDEAVKKQWPFNERAKFYLILNMALGSNSDAKSWAGPIDDNKLPAVMEVDWVRITQPIKK